VSTIRETVERTVGFHGRLMDPVMASVTEALEVREAQIQADLLQIALHNGMDEDEVLDILPKVFGRDAIDVVEPSVQQRLDQLYALVRSLNERVADLADLI